MVPSQPCFNADASRLRSGRGSRGGAQRFHRRLGDAGVFRSLAAGLECQSAPFVLWAAEGGRAFSVNVLKKGQLELAAHYRRPAGPDNKLALMEWTTGRIGVPLLLAERCTGLVSVNS